MQWGVEGFQIIASHKVVLCLLRFTVRLRGRLLECPRSERRGVGVIPPFTALRRRVKTHNSHSGTGLGKTETGNHTPGNHKMVKKRFIKR